jgi:hypothetical protein
MAGNGVRELAKKWNINSCFKVIELESGGKMHLAADLFKSTGRVEALTNDVGGHGFNFSDFEMAFTKVV